jgi:hypothetical protein
MVSIYKEDSDDPGFTDGFPPNQQKWAKPCILLEEMYAFSGGINNGEAEKEDPISVQTRQYQ